MSNIVAKKTIIPALSESPLLRYATFIALYFSQGIPEGITIFGIPAWMAANGKSSVEIASYGAIVIIPFSFKIILAPMMERYTFLPMGRRRPWLLFGQFGILISLVALSFVPDAMNNLQSLILLSLCVHIFVMFQDIATDSLVIDIVPLEQQGKANSLMWGSKTIGTSLSLAIGSWLNFQYGFSTAVLTMAIGVFFIMFIPLLLRERSGEKLVPWSEGVVSPDAALLKIDSWAQLFKSFKKVLFLHNSLLLAMVLFITMLGLHYVRTLLPIFTIQGLGWNNVFYSKIYSTSNVAGGVIGMFLGGFLIIRFGVIRMMQSGLLAAAILVGTFSLLTGFWHNNNLVTVFIALFCMLLTLINIGGLALAMQMCWKRISAMQFTFCMTIFNLGLAAGAAFLGLLRTYFEWQGILLIFPILAVIAIIFLQVIKLHTHLAQIEVLENNYLKEIDI